ncbi:hypothetical protein ACFPPD_20280 [Cohnella suwonensis]|uniref:DUF4367 domain-containing protein n=1 Tax=Cohnella suwonensis TaxID=696072 RepID=A0ABW0LZ02_9BACL
MHEHESRKPDWYSQLKEGPIPNAMPDARQIGAIVDRARASSARGKKVRLSVALGFCVAVFLMIAGCLFAYDYDRKRDIAQAAVPNSAEWAKLQDAVEAFRRYPEGQMQMQYVQPISDGVLVFYQRFFKPDETDISMEYMRKTLWGWKWIHGGGGGGTALRGKNLLFGEYIPSPDAYLRTKTPFPIVYGTIKGDAVRVAVSGDNGYAAEATVFPSGGQMGWFAYWPESAGRLIKLESIGADGRVLAEKTIDTDEYRNGGMNSAGVTQATATTVPAKDSE